MTATLDGLDWWLAVGLGMIVVIVGLFTETRPSYLVVALAVFAVYASLPLWAIAVQTVRTRGESE